MAATDLIDRLAAHKALAAAPRAELEWLVAHGSLRHLKEDEVLTAKGAPVTGLFVVLTGHIAVFVDRGAGRHKVLESRAGDVTGMLPYSRLVSPPGDSVAQEPTEILVVPREDLPALIRECHEITSILVHSMIDRSKIFSASGLHDEKMLSLGRLSAGLAHELNNPAAAIERSAALLGERLEDAQQAARALGAFELSDGQLAIVDGLRTSCFATRLDGVLSPIQHAEREDAIADWLADHGIDTAFAGPIAETAVTLDALDRIAAAVSGPPLAAVLRWEATGCSVRALAAEIQEAAKRISKLVADGEGLHAHGPGNGGRARRPHARPGEHGRGAQIKSKGEIRRRQHRRSSRPAARPWLCRRAQPDLGRISSTTRSMPSPTAAGSR